MLSAEQMRLIAVGNTHGARQFNKYSYENGLSEVWREMRALIIMHLTASKMYLLFGLKIHCTRNINTDTCHFLGLTSLWSSRVTEYGKNNHIF